jgi:hypothetical protein
VLQVVSTVFLNVAPYHLQTATEPVSLKYLMSECGNFLTKYSNECEIIGSRSGADEDSRHLEYDAM